MRTRLSALALGLVLSACADREPEEPASGAEPADSAAPAPAETTISLEKRLNPEVLARIRDREAWSHRVLTDTSVPAERKAEAAAEVAMLYHAYDLFDEGYEAYSQATKINPDDYRWHYLGGMAARRVNDLVAAAAAFERATTLAPEDVPSWVRLGEVARDRGERARATDALSKALELDPDCAAALFALGQQARNDGDLELAAERFERVLEVQPEASVVRTPLGLTYRDLGREEEAAAQLERAGDQGVSLDDPLLQRIYDLGEGWIQVMRAANEAAQAGDLDAAEDRLKAAIALDPLSTSPRLSWARVLTHRGDHEGAKEQAELALFLAADPLEARRALARIAIDERDWTAAERELRRVAALPGATRSDSIDLGAVLESGGKPTEALSLYRDLRAARPEDPNLVVSEATQLVRLGRCSDALEVVSAELEQRPNDAILGHARARLLVGCEPSDPNQALQIAESLFAALPSAGHAEAVALAHAGSGRFDQAVEWQRRALELASVDSPARSHHRYVLERLERRQLPPLPWPPAVRSWIFAAPNPPAEGN